MSTIILPLLLTLATSLPTDSLLDTLVRYVEKEIFVDTTYRFHSLTTFPYRKGVAHPWARKCFGHSRAMTKNPAICNPEPRVYVVGTEKYNSEKEMFDYRAITLFWTGKRWDTWEEYGLLTGLTGEIGLIYRRFGANGNFRILWEKDRENNAP